jgi:hypothetical protein
MYTQITKSKTRRNKLHPWYMFSKRARYTSKNVQKETKYAKSFAAQLLVYIFIRIQKQQTNPLYEHNVTNYFSLIIRVRIVTTGVSVTSRRRQWVLWWLHRVDLDPSF